MQAPSRLLAVALLAGLVGACTAVRKQGEECVFNDDCAESLVCAARRCRAECRDARDCVAGWKCAAVHQDARRVCVPGNHPDFCRYHSECASPQACGFDGLCRYQCRAPRDCADFSPSLRCEADAGLCLWPEESPPP